MAEPAASIRIRVELFGLSRLRSGIREVDLDLPSLVSRREVVGALAQACPALVGNGLREDLTGLEDGYLFNRNGTAFLGGEDISLRSGDCLLLLSGQAGG